MDYGKRIRLLFDAKIYNVSSSLKDHFRLIETTYGTYIYPINVTYGATDSEIYLEFEDFNQAVEPLNLEYVGGTTLGGVDFPLEAFLIVPIIKKLEPTSILSEYVNATIVVTGENLKYFNGETYLDEYINTSISMSVAINLQLVFVGTTINTEHINTVISMVGQYCDINGTPL